MQQHNGILLPFNMEQADSIFLLLLICFLLFAHVYKGGFSYLKENTTLVFSYEKSRRRHNEDTIKEYWYSYFLVIQFIILSSIALFDIFTEYNSDQARVVPNPLFTILAFCCLIGLFVCIKILVYKLIGYIFNNKAIASSWTHLFLVSLQMLGIVYFIPVLLLIYSNYWHPVLVGFMLILFLIVQLLLFYRIIIYFFAERFNFLFLITYLCSAEIIPYVFLVVGLIQLYKIDTI